jgi:hypothetical protein
MHSRVMSLAVLIVFIALGQVGAQSGTGSHPCSLLSGEQISAAVGNVGESKEGDMPGKAHMRACSWSIPGGLFILSVGKVPDSNLSTRQLLDNINSIYDVLKGQGWKHDKKDFGTISCSLLTPPAEDANGSPMTSCATVAKGMLVMASASSKASIAPEKLKSLTETAAAHLP